jgi:hypothetical protein
MSLTSLRGPIETHKGDGRHVLREEISFDNVEHLPRLTEDQNAVLRGGFDGESSFIGRSNWSTNAAVEENLAERENGGKWGRGGTV